MRARSKRLPDDGRLAYTTVEVARMLGVGLERARLIARHVGVRTPSGGPKPARFLVSKERLTAFLNGELSVDAA